jgi:hypothetical protein
MEKRKKNNHRFGKQNRPSGSNVHLSGLDGRGRKKHRALGFLVGLNHI